MSKIKRTDISAVRRKSEAEPSVNKYYLTVSNRFMVSKYLSIVVLIVFFAFMMIRFDEDITYTNLMYLMRDLNTGDDIISSDFSSIEYDEQENMSYAVYKGELSVIGNRTLKMYNVRGEETRSYEPGYSDPALVSSDKYLLAYNVGTPSYSVFTSIARVNNGEAPGNIESAHINEKGEYLFVCRSTDTKYVVCTYDSSFRPIAKYHKTRYVTSAAIGDNGNVIVASFDSNGTMYDCEVELYKEGSEKPDFTYSVSGAFPVKCGIFPNGEYYVICTDRILFFDEDGALTGTDNSLTEYTAYTQSDNRLAVSGNNDSLGSTSSVLVFDTTGKLLYNNVIDGSVSSLSLCNEEFFALASSRVYKLSYEKDEISFEDVSPGGAVLLPYGNTSVLCYRNLAQGVFVADNSEETSWLNSGIVTEAK